MASALRGRTSDRVRAQGEGTRQRLISAGIFPERVDELLAAYEALPEAQGRPLEGEARPPLGPGPSPLSPYPRGGGRCLPPVHHEEQRHEHDQALARALLGYEMRVELGVEPPSSGATGGATNILTSKSPNSLAIPHARASSSLSNGPHQRIEHSHRARRRTARVAARTVTQYPEPLTRGSAT